MTSDPESTATSETVAIVGAGTIGISWAALAAARGHRVRVSDPRDDLAGFVEETVRALAPGIPGAEADDLLARITVADSLADAVREAAVVHESGPERIDLKRALFVEIATAAPDDALLLTSTSGLSPTEIARDLADPGRMLVAHPFNPPHVLPLVEVVPGVRTDPGAVEATLAYLSHLGRTPVVVHREVDGFVANRLQRALFTEAVSLVADGVVSVAELDRIVTSSLGVRWATGGPFLSFHLGGGPGGLRHMIEHLMSGRFSPEAAAAVIDGTEQTYGTDRYPTLVEQRDVRLNAVLDALRDTPDPQPTGVSR